MQLLVDNKWEERQHAPNRLVQGTHLTSSRNPVNYFLDAEGVRSPGGTRGLRHHGGGVIRRVRVPLPPSFCSHLYPPGASVSEDAPRRVVQRDVAQRWTPTLARAGWTPVSDFFLDHFHRLNPPITHGEAMLVVLLMRHKWDDAPPFPGFKSLSKRLGMSITAARQLARRLETKGFLIREQQKGETNRFHLQPLFQALEALMKKDSGETTELSGAELLGTFMAAWIRLEQTAGEVARKLTQHGNKTQMQRSPILAISTLAGVGIIDPTLHEEIDTIRRIRDAVTHGVGDFKKTITPALIQRLEDVTRQLEAAGRMTDAERQERIARFMTGSFRKDTTTRPSVDVDIATMPAPTKPTG
jgi:hypothetical protein